MSKKHKLLCDECCKEIGYNDSILVADNYDYGSDWVFCSKECFEKFNKVRVYEHAFEYDPSLKQDQIEHEIS